jgi:predicted nucleotide-binding protein
MGGKVSPASWLSTGRAEESGACSADGFDKEAAVEVKIPRLATRFCDQEAAVTCRAMERAVFVCVSRVMIGADRIARAQCEAVEGSP